MCCLDALPRGGEQTASPGDSQIEIPKWNSDEGITIVIQPGSEIVLSFRKQDCI